jgi:hypothetical protein
VSPRTHGGDGWLELKLSEAAYALAAVLWRMGKEREANDAYQEGLRREATGDLAALRCGGGR